MTQLKWTPPPGVAFVPGWPAADHDEPDAKLAEAKIASGLYQAESGAKTKPAAPAEGEE